MVAEDAGYPISRGGLNFFVEDDDIFAEAGLGYFEDVLLVGGGGSIQGKGGGGVNRVKFSNR